MQSNCVIWTDRRMDGWTDGWTDRGNSNKKSCCPSMGNLTTEFILPDLTQKFPIQTEKFVKNIEKFCHFCNLWLESTMPWHNCLLYRATRQMELLRPGSKCPQTSCSLLRPVSLMIFQLHFKFDTEVALLLFHVTSCRFRNRIKTRTTTMPAFWGYPPPYPHHPLITNIIDSYWIPYKKNSHLRMADPAAA